MTAAPAYTYDPRTRVWHDHTGKAIRATELVALRDSIADDAGEQCRAVTAAYLAGIGPRQAIALPLGIGDALRSGVVTLGDWAARMAELIRSSTVAGYLLGRGGAGMMMPADDARLGGVMDTYLHAARMFGVDLANGDAGTDEEATARAASYGGGAVAGYSAGQSAAWGVEMPDVPPQHAHCRCVSRYDVDGDGQIIGYWDAMPGACVLCDDLAAQYSPWESGVYADSGGDVPSDVEGGG